MNRDHKVVKFHTIIVDPSAHRQVTYKPTAYQIPDTCDSVDGSIPTL